MPGDIIEKNNHIIKRLIKNLMKKRAEHNVYTTLTNFSKNRRQGKRQRFF